ncbi:hypothetical protein M0R72_08880 [Candidatus Pacearchaeota archaeon]|nr:hypothetical protein [Candidatus Pacearchaeota archaeon]
MEAQGECCWVDADAVTDVREGGQEVPAGSAIVERIHDDADHILGSAATSIPS